MAYRVEDYYNDDNSLQFSINSSPAEEQISEHGDNAVARHAHANKAAPSSSLGSFAAESAAGHGASPHTMNAMFYTSVREGVLHVLSSPKDTAEAKPHRAIPEEEGEFDIAMQSPTHHHHTRIGKSEKKEYHTLQHYVRHRSASSSLHSASTSASSSSSSRFYRHSPPPSPRQMSSAHHGASSLRGTSHSHSHRLQHEANRSNSLDGDVDTPPRRSAASDLSIDFHVATASTVTTSGPAHVLRALTREEEEQPDEDEVNLCSSVDIEEAKQGDVNNNSTKEVQVQDKEQPRANNAVKTRITSAKDEAEVGNALSQSTLDPPFLLATVKGITTTAAAAATLSPHNTPTTPLPPVQASTSNPPNNNSIDIAVANHEKLATKVVNRVKFTPHSITTEHFVSPSDVISAPRSTSSLLRANGIMKDDPALTVSETTALTYGTAPVTAAGSVHRPPPTKTQIRQRQSQRVEEEEDNEDDDVATPPSRFVKRHIHGVKTVERLVQPTVAVPPRPPDNGANNTTLHATPALPQPQPPLPSSSSAQQQQNTKSARHKRSFFGKLGHLFKMRCGGESDIVANRSKRHTKGTAEEGVEGKAKAAVLNTVGYNSAASVDGQASSANVQDNNATQRKEKGDEEAMTRQSEAEVKATSKQPSTPLPLNTTNEVAHKEEEEKQPSLHLPEPGQHIANAVPHESFTHISSDAFQVQNGTEFDSNEDEPFILAADHNCEEEEIVLVEHAAAAVVDDHDELNGCTEVQGEANGSPTDPARAVTTQWHEAEDNTDLHDVTTHDVLQAEGKDTAVPLSSYEQYYEEEIRKMQAEKYAATVKQQQEEEIAMDFARSSAQPSATQEPKRAHFTKTPQQQEKQEEQGKEEDKTTVPASSKTAQPVAATRKRRKSREAQRLGKEELRRLQRLSTAEAKLEAELAALNDRLRRQRAHRIYRDDLESRTSLPAIHVQEQDEGKAKADSVEEQQLPASQPSALPLLLLHDRADEMNSSAAQQPQRQSEVLQSSLPAKGKSGGSYVTRQYQRRAQHILHDSTTSNSLTAAEATNVELTPATSHGSEQHEKPSALVLRDEAVTGEEVLREACRLLRRRYYYYEDASRKGQTVNTNMLAATKEAPYTEEDILKACAAKLRCLRPSCTACSPTTTVEYMLWALLANSNNNNSSALSGDSSDDSVAMIQRLLTARVSLTQQIREELYASYTGKAPAPERKSPPAPHEVAHALTESALHVMLAQHSKAKTRAARTRRSSATKHKYEVTSEELVKDITPQPQPQDTQAAMHHTTTTNDEEEEVIEDVTPQPQPQDTQADMHHTTTTNDEEEEVIEDVIPQPQPQDTQAAMHHTTTTTTSDDEEVIEDVTPQPQPQDTQVDMHHTTTTTSDDEVIEDVIPQPQPQDTQADMHHTTTTTSDDEDVIEDVTSQPQPQDTQADMHHTTITTTTSGEEDEVNKDITSQPQPQDTQADMHHTTTTTTSGEGEVIEDVTPQPQPQDTQADMHHTTTTTSDDEVIEDVIPQPQPQDTQADMQHTTTTTSDEEVIEDVIPQPQPQDTQADMHHTTTTSDDEVIEDVIPQPQTQDIQADMHHTTTTSDDEDVIEDVTSQPQPQDTQVDMQHTTTTTSDDEEVIEDVTPQPQSQYTTSKSDGRRVHFSTEVSLIEGDIAREEKAAAVVMPPEEVETQAEPDTSFLTPAQDADIHASTMADLSSLQNKLQDLDSLLLHQLTRYLSSSDRDRLNATMSSDNNTNDVIGLQAAEDVMQQRSASRKAELPAKVPTYKPRPTCLAARLRMKYPNLLRSQGPQ